MEKYNKLELPTNAYKITEAISLTDCETLVQWIKEENEMHGHHMLEPDAQELWEEANAYGCCCIKHQDILIWFIKLMPVQKDGLILFERWSLFIKPWYRNQWLWKHLVATILNKQNHLPVYSVTNVPAVHHINQSLWQYQYTTTDIPQQILDTIETAGKLLDDDMIYANEILHTLIQTWW